MNSFIPTNLSPFKTLLVLVTLSAGTSIAVYYPIAQWIVSADLDLRFGVVPFAIVMIIVHGVLFRGIADALTQIYVALMRMRQNLPVSEIPPNTSYILSPTIEQVNAFIRERVDLKAMRGVLVEQISEAAAQEERNRLARDLHDSIKQQVFSMSISAAAASAHLESNPPAARAALDDVKQSAQEAMVEMRALLQQLSPAPLEKSGLIQALRDQCEALAYRTGAVVTPHVSQKLPPDDRLPPGAQETIFRIAQEALSNIARHARAQHVQLSLDYEPDQPVIFRVSDDGQGFNTADVAVGMGLSNIRSRAESVGGQLVIESASGRGTTLTLTIPLIQPLEQREDDSMYAHYDGQLKPIIDYYFRFAGWMSGFIFSLSLLCWRLIYRQDTLTDDPISMILLVGLAVLAVVSIPMGVWGLRRAHHAMTPLLDEAGRDGRIGLKLRRHIHMVYLVIMVIAGWFVPMLWIDESPDNWRPVVMAGGFLAVAIWNYGQMRRLYRAELDLMRAENRLPELNQRLNEIRSGWPSVVFLFIVTGITSFISGEIRIPPLETDHWMNTAFITISLVLLANQIGSLWTYRRWKREFSG